MKVANLATYPVAKCMIMQNSMKYGYSLNILSQLFFCLNISKRWSCKKGTNFQYQVTSYVRNLRRDSTHIPDTDTCAVHFIVRFHKRKYNARKLTKEYFEISRKFFFSFLVHYKIYTSFRNWHMQLPIIQRSNQRTRTALKIIF